jgi:hypothetical protein
MMLQGGFGDFLLLFYCRKGDREAGIGIGVRIEAAEASPTRRS